ncbi:YdcF family protein [Brevibacillus invocatus]|nr:YdcF family protein [Brevibacillus invocatus]MCM3079475.1 YdcF family protein [Brevibacillus invocatus]MCM3429473.1 YdcF family protein [Brevibacillus invocatus]
MFFKRMKAWRKKILVPLLGILILGATWAGYNWYLIEKTIQEAAPRHADVGIVLGAAVWGERPSPGLRERLDYALWLYNEGYVEYLLVTGGLGEGKKVTEAFAMQQYLLEQGVPADAILLEEKATSTYENLLYSQQVMESVESVKLKSALVISHDYHIARAKTMADDLELPAAAVGVQSHVLYSPYHKVREILALAHWQVTRIWN